MTSIVDPDGFITEYYTNNFNELQKPPNNRFQNLNYNKLSSEDKNLNIEINIQLSEKLIIKEVIEWNLEETTKSPYKFAEELVSSLESEIESEDLIAKNKKNIANEIRDQIVFYIEEKTFSSRIRLVKNEYETPMGNLTCGNCGTYKYNNEICVNCLYVFDKRALLPETNLTINNNNITGLDLVEDRNKDLNCNVSTNMNSINNSIYSNFISNNISLNTNFVKDKEIKICKNCGELNQLIKSKCKNCNNKFPLSEILSSKINDYFSINYWEKIIKHSVISHLTNFESRFIFEDFTSLKYLHNKIIFVIKKHYKNKLTKEAYDEVIAYLKKMYNLFTNKNSLTFEKVLENSYSSRYKKPKPKPIYNFFNHNISNNSFTYGYNNNNINVSGNAGSSLLPGASPYYQLSINDLKNVAEGSFIPENYYELFFKKLKLNINNNKTKVLFSAISTNNNIGGLDHKKALKVEQELGYIHHNNKTNTNNNNNDTKLIARKRGRPRKLEIFKADDEAIVKGVLVNDRLKLFENKEHPLPTAHYDFCGKCFGAKDDNNNYYKDENNSYDYDNYNNPRNKGRFLRCESCASSYHYECLNYDKPPKGKFKCYYCKVVKLGIENSAFVDINQIKLMKRLSKPIKNMKTVKLQWNIKLNQFIDMILDHPCSTFFKEAVPKHLNDYFEEHSENIYLDLISSKVKTNKYNSPQEFIDELYKVFYNNMSYFNSGSFMYQQVKTLYMFSNHLILKERVLGDLVNVGSLINLNNKSNNTEVNGTNVINLESDNNKVPNNEKNSIVDESNNSNKKTKNKIDKENDMALCEKKIGKNAEEEGKSILIYYFINYLMFF